MLPGIPSLDRLAHQSAGTVHFSSGYQRGWTISVAGLTERNGVGTIGPWAKMRARPGYASCVWEVMRPGVPFLDRSAHRSAGTVLSASDSDRHCGISNRAYDSVTVSFAIRIPNGRKPLARLGYASRVWEVMLPGVPSLDRLAHRPAGTVLSDHSYLSASMGFPVARR